MRSLLSIDVAAPPDIVFALVQDVARWPQLLPHYLSVRVERVTAGEALVARYVALRPIVGGAVWLGLPVVWRSASWPDVDERGVRLLRFRHLGGATNGMEVTWRFEPARTGSRVTIEHRLRRRLPLPILGPLLGSELFPAVVDRLVVRPVASQTLRTVRSLAEALAAASQMTAQAGRAGSLPKPAVQAARGPASSGSPAPSPVPVLERKEGHGRA